MILQVGDEVDELLSGPSTFNGSETLRSDGVVCLPGENVTRLTTDGYQQVWVFLFKELGGGKVWN